MPDMQQWFQADHVRAELAVTTPAGDILRLPLKSVLDHALMAKAHSDDPGELLRWTWTWTDPSECPVHGDQDDCDYAPTMPPRRRAARLLVEEIPLVVPVRRQLEDGTWGTVMISQEEWAQAEGRRHA